MEKKKYNYAKPGRGETREQLIAFVRQEYGESTVDVVNRFIDFEGNHPFEEKALLMREIRYGINRRDDV